jgi:hypothetical protein
MMTFLFLGAAAVSGLGYLVWRRDRRSGNTGERPADTHRAEWLHKSEGI